MSRRSQNKYYIKLRSKFNKKSKGGYVLNRNGMPLSNRGENVLSSSVSTGYQYKGNLRVGHYRPTVHNISDI